MSLDTLLEAARYIEQQELRHRLEEGPAGAGETGPGVRGVRGASPARVALLAAPAGHVAAPYAASNLIIHTQHSLHSTITANHSPGAGGSSGGVGGAGCGLRAGTREVHNKLEKNRRAHLKECFELLKKQLPAADDKKASNLAILGSANRYIQVLRRKERECEHEMERLAREKIAAQQRLAALKREVSLRTHPPPHPPPPPPVSHDNHADSAGRSVSEERREHDEIINGHVVGIPISITSTPEGGGGGALTTTHAVMAPLTITPHQNGVSENGLNGGVTTALVHSAHLHLPLSQMVRGGVVVGGAALQLVAGGGGLRVLTHAHAHALPNRVGGREAGREGGDAVSTDSGSVVVTPLVVSQGQAQLLHAHTLTHKVVETQVQYVGGALVKPLMVVSAAPAPAPAPAPPHT